MTLEQLRVAEKEADSKKVSAGPVQKVFVNGWGEATTREITSPSWKRQQKKLSQSFFVCGK